MSAEEKNMRSDVDRVTSTLSLSERWRLYFRERFPLALHAPVVAVFSSSSFIFAWVVIGQRSPPSAISLTGAFIVTLLFFLQLRIADEFKDFEEDQRFRPYRPVPRGIVTLRGLSGLCVISAGVQAASSALFGMRALAALAVVWAYFGLMAVEFFVGKWLKSHPATYMASHMMALPLIVAYVAICAGAVSVSAPLLWYAGTSYLGFCVFEIGRKIRSPADEEEGVETYSAVWGRQRAVLAWLGAMAGSGIFAALAARDVDALALTAGVAAVVIVLAAGVGGTFLNEPRAGRGRVFFAMSGIWLVVIYLAVGAGSWRALLADING